MRRSVVQVDTAGADLHMHTTASDGTLAPAAMVDLARAQGLEAMAITDHDTTAGLAEALAAARGLTVIPGVELSTELPGGVEVHILGYFVQQGDGPLADLLARMRHGRQQRAEVSVAQLRGLGLPVELARVLELGGDTVGRPHIAAALVECGAATDVRDAFDRYLVRGRPGYAPRPKLTPEEAIGTLIAAGTVPIVAHPGLIGDDSLLRQFVSAGAAGLEAYHSDHSPEQCLHYARLAAAENLLITGGSDSHGNTGARPVLPGQVRVDMAAVWDLLDHWRYADQRRQTQFRE